MTVKEYDIGLKVIDIQYIKSDPWFKISFKERKETYLDLESFSPAVKNLFIDMLPHYIKDAWENYIKLKKENFKGY